MKEERYIESLFEAARSEAPNVSFEEVAQQLVKATQPSLMEIIRDLFAKKITLNIFTMIITGSFMSLIIWAMLGTTPEVVESTNYPVNHPTEELDKKVPSIVVPSTTSKSPKKELLQRFTPAQQQVAPPNKILDTSSIIPQQLSVKEQNLPILKDHEMGPSTYNEEKPSFFTPTPVGTGAGDLIQESSDHSGELEEVLFILRNTDNKAKAIQFGKSLTNQGLGVLINPKYNAKGTKLERFTLNLWHDKGLDWKIKVNGFSSLEMKLYLDEKNQIQKLSYRMNEKGKFSMPFKISHHKIRTKIKGGNDVSKAKTKVQSESN